MNSLNLRCPLLLVHGIGAQDSSKYIAFWGRIPQTLEALGLRLYLGNTDAWGSYKTNAAMLGETLDSAIKECGCERVNIIAHSKGGIDARYLISGLGYASRVASLTTICTPHRGSELADLVFAASPGHRRLIRGVVRALAKLYGDRIPDPQTLVQELTRAAMEEFNEKYPNAPDVYYQSYYCTMRGPGDDPSLALTYSYIRSIGGENDGIVSAASAAWGEQSRLITGRNSGISHAEIVDFKKRRISGTCIPEVYVKIVAELGNRGF